MLDVYISKDFWCHDFEIVSGQVQHLASDVDVVSVGERQDWQADEVDVDEEVVDAAVVENVAAGNQSTDPSSCDADGGVDHLESGVDGGSPELHSCQQQQTWQVRTIGKLAVPLPSLWMTEQV